MHVRHEENKVDIHTVRYEKHDRVVRLRNLGMKFVTVTHAICKDISNILLFTCVFKFWT